MNERLKKVSQEHLLWRVRIGIDTCSQSIISQLPFELGLFYFLPLETRDAAGRPVAVLNIAQVKRENGEVESLKDFIL